MFKITTPFCLSVLFIFPYLAFCQITQKDSTKIAELISKSQEVNYVNVDSSRRLATEALVISERLSYQDGIALSYNRIGITIKFRVRTIAH